ncbi:MAG: penicillin acylase family protein [Flavobacteriales bacterium]|jgi:penicillin amidase|nr:penicillin acylase family protein [Flavobacteriales bacterium]
MITLKDNQITIQRVEGEIPEVKAENENDLFFGIGYCHAYDRGIQMMVMKTLGAGRAAELLKGSPEMIEIDRFFRSTGWQYNIQSEVEKFSAEELEKLQAYCDGANECFRKRKPWELSILLGFKDFEWTIGDMVLLSRMIGYLTLAQAQGEIEHLFIELVQKGISKELLNELFPEILGDYDEELLKKIQLVDNIIPEAVKQSKIVDPMMASNNWVISGEKSASGEPLLVNDPHLEINRLPSVWYEVRLNNKGNYSHGMTMPGICGLLIGANGHLAWGTTYAFMDAIDSWVEQCKDESYLKDGEWIPFKKREEVIKVKGKKAQKVTFYENEHGVLQGEPTKEGYYLSSRWSGQDGGATSIKNGLLMFSRASVEEGMECLGQFEMAFNWVLADKTGNIGYQMSGLLPKRKAGVSDFVPLIGWDSTYDWKGYYPHTDLPSELNPENGVIATANEKITTSGKVPTQTIAMGDYRSKRIKQLLSEKEKLGVEDMKEMHYDVYSIQAEKFMHTIRPLLPDTPSGICLRDWDLCYDIDSEGAFLFEQVYRSLYAVVFGPVIGKTTQQFLQNETGVFVDFYENFDKVLLKESSAWFGEKTKQAIYEEAIRIGLEGEVKKWGEVNQFSLKNILLGEALPQFLGFNKGPFALPGGRATILQGQVYRANNRNTTFAPSCRMIVDFGEETIYTNYSGGVSDRRFSKNYNNDFQNWDNKIYRKYSLAKPT